MGMSCTFKCNKCGYDVESAGDLSYGMEAVLHPYICNDCNIVTDAIVGRYGVVYPYNLISGMPLSPKGDRVPAIVLDMKNRFYKIQIRLEFLLNPKQD